MEMEMEMEVYAVFANYQNQEAAQLVLVTACSTDSWYSRNPAKNFA